MYCHSCVYFFGVAIRVCHILTSVTCVHTLCLAVTAILYLQLSVFVELKEELAVVTAGIWASDCCATMLKNLIMMMHVSH